MFILGAGHYHPGNVIDNKFLESLDIGTSDEWILDRVGINTRRTVLPLDYIQTTRNQDPRIAHELAPNAVTELGVFAAQLAMKRAKIDPSDIKLCIASVSIPQACIPANACLMASELGINAPSLDLNSACSSLLAGLHFIKNMNISGPILLIQSETYTMATNYNNRETAVLWGDGASAIIVSHDIAGKAKVIETTFESRPKDCLTIQIPYGGHFKQEGNRVQRFAITQTESLFNSLNKMSPDTNFIGHQANLRMLESVAKRINVSEDRHFFNVDKYGNCGAAGAGSVLSEKWDDFLSGERLIIATVGAGLSWGGGIINFI